MMNHKLCVSGLSLTLAVTLSAACGSSVGSDDCVGEHTRCVSPPLTARALEPDTVSVSTKGLAELTPTWIRPLPNELVGRDQEQQLLLRDDREALFCLVPTADGVHVHRLDDSGDVQDSAVVSPPAGRSVPDAAGTQLFRAPHTGPGLAVQVFWDVDCNEPGPRCDPHEWMLIDSDTMQPTQRVTSIELAAGDSHGNTYRFVKQAGDPSNPYAVEKRDARGRLVWKQTQLRGERPRADIFGGAMLADNQFVGLYNDGVSDDRDYTDNMFVLDEDGNALLHDRLFASIEGHPMLLQGTKGPLLVGTVASDFFLLHMVDVRGTWQGARVLQEDFTPLRVRAAAVDLDDNLYAFTVIGGRDLADQRLVVCTSPVTDAPTCYQLSPSIADTIQVGYFQLVARRHGELYMMTRGELARIDLPQ